MLEASQQRYKVPQKTLKYSGKFQRQEIQIFLNL